MSHPGGETFVGASLHPSFNKISEITGCSVEVSSDAKEYSYPETSIIKIKKEFNFHPTDVLDKIEYMIKEFEIFLKNK